MVVAITPAITRSSVIEFSKTKAQELHCSARVARQVQRMSGVLVASAGSVKRRRPEDDAGQEPSRSRVDPAVNKHKVTACRMFQHSSCLLSYASPLLSPQLPRVPLPTLISSVPLPPTLRSSIAF